jgi:hypothetical protein
LLYAKTIAAAYAVKIAVAEALVVAPPPLIFTVGAAI